MLMINMLCITIPLGYTIARIEPSGAFVKDYSRWMDPTFATTACGGGERVVGCTDCLVDGFTPSETVCFTAGTDTFASGVQTTMAVLCGECPSGCGPFRNFPSVYQVIVLEFNTWPETLRTIIDYIGTISFGTVLVFILLTWILMVKAKLNAHSRLIEKIRIERDLERMDKVWILERWAITLDGAAAAERQK